MTVPVTKGNEMEGSGVASFGISCGPGPRQAVCTQTRLRRTREAVPEVEQCKSFMHVVPHWVSERKFVGAHRLRRVDECDGPLPVQLIEYRRKSGVAKICAFIVRE
jgi:hypothetical protein